MEKINLNMTVKVKLNPKGVEVYYHQYDELIDAGEKVERQLPPVDKDGFTEIQLWRFINIFGRYLTMGAPPVMEDMNIYIP